MKTPVNIFVTYRVTDYLHDSRVPTETQSIYQMLICLVDSSMRYLIVSLLRNVLLHIHWHINFLVEIFFLTSMNEYSQQMVTIHRGHMYVSHRATRYLALDKAGILPFSNAFRGSDSWDFALAEHGSRSTLLVYCRIHLNFKSNGVTKAFLNSHGENGRGHSAVGREEGREGQSCIDIWGWPTVWCSVINWEIEASPRKIDRVHPIKGTKSLGYWHQLQFGGQFHKRAYLSNSTSCWPWDSICSLASLLSI